MNANPASHYVSTLRPFLPRTAFTPRASRLWTLALHLALIAAGIGVIASGCGGLPVTLLMSLVVGHSFTGMAFVGHELLHGSILRSRRQSHLLGWLTLLPFTLSPTLWKAWHNRVHHGNTARPGLDPDAYPTLEEFASGWKVRAMEKFSVARGHWLGAICLAAGFSIQSLQILLTARRRGFLGRKAHLRAIAESLAGVAVWAALEVAIGPRAFLFAYVVPLVIANAVAMGYILTNHNLNPLTAVNDPLLNSLTVTVPRWVDALHSRFGLHVEHHLFPAMSAHHLPEVRRLLQERWPERYQSMPLTAALARLASTPRVYRAHTELFDPKTGFTAPTLLPRPLQPEA